ncbi:MAG TPA: Uma2 family endonuclease [Allocoleopsis sp.]
MINLSTEIIYPDSDGEPMAESDSARDYLIYGVESLKIHFKKRTDVYVSGNLFIYYEKGNPSAVISPDVFVVFGVENKQRMSYKTWEENHKVPDFVLEVTSKQTKKVDQEDKPLKYATLGVKEYFQYDPTGDYLKPVLQGGKLVNGSYEKLPLINLENGELMIFSEVLGLELRVIQGELRFYDPVSGKKLLTTEERELERLRSDLARQLAEDDKRIAEAQKHRVELEKQQVELEKQQVELEKQQVEEKARIAEAEKQQVELEKQQVEEKARIAEAEKQQVENQMKNAIPKLKILGLSDEQIAQTLGLDLSYVQQILMQE